MSVCVPCVNSVGARTSIAVVNRGCLEIISEAGMRESSIASSKQSGKRNTWNYGATWFLSEICVQKSHLPPPLSLRSLISQPVIHCAGRRADLARGRPLGDAEFRARSLK